MDDSRPVLVTGANGFIGSHLVDHLVARGRSVRAMVRTFRPDPRVETVVADLRLASSLPPVVEDIHTVYHVAGSTVQRNERDYSRVNAEGARSLIRACRKTGVRRFVLVSSMAAGGPAREGRPVRETDAPRPVSEYGRSKLEGERLTFDEAGPIEVTAVRPSVVYGPRDPNTLEFFRMVESGFLPTFSPAKYISIIHVRDLVRGIVLAGESPASPGHILNLANPSAPSFLRVLELMAECVGATPRHIPVPSALLRLAGGILDAVGRGLSLKIRPLKDKVRELLQDLWVVDTNRAERRLGFTARIPLPEGLVETVADYRRRGWLRRGVPAV
jgi:nucleoside-diphosphate-sugar epimerase